MTPMEISPKLKVIAWKRVSTDHQDNARQDDSIREVAEQYGLEIIEVVEANGVSGSDVERDPQHQYMMKKLAQNQEIAGIVTDAIDRGGRPQRYGDFGVWDPFADMGKHIWTRREGHIDPNTDEGFDILVGAAHRAGTEKREFRRRSINGKLKNARKGFVNSGSAPYGYDHVFVDKRTRTRATWIINEREAEVVRRIFAWAVVERLGVYAIAKRLNIEGVPSKRAGQIHSKTTGKMNSGKWSQKVVYQLLTNPIYTGTFEIFHRGMPDAIKGHCAPIIEEDVFQIVQLELKGNGNGQKTGKVSRKYSLSGLGYCLLCGHRLTTFPRPFPRAYYRCGHIDRRPPMKRLCDAPCIDKNLLETTVLNAVLSTVADGVTLSRMIEATHTDQEIDNDTVKIQEAQASVNFLRQAEEHAFLNVQDPRLPRERTIGTWEEAKTARQNAEFALSLLEKNRLRPVPSSTAIEAMARELAAYKPETLDEQKAFLRLLVKEFRTNGSDVTIEIAIPESLLANASDGGKEKENRTTVRGIRADQWLCSPAIRPTLNQPICFTINAKLNKSV